MATSEAFIAAWSKWSEPSNSSSSSVNVDAANHSSPQPGMVASTSTEDARNVPADGVDIGLQQAAAASPLTEATTLTTLVESVSRIANALESIAGLLPAFISAVESTAPSTSGPPTIAPTISPTVAPPTITPPAITPPTGAHSSVPSSAPLQKSAPASAPAATSSSSAGFDYGLGDMFADSDDEIEQSTRCGVCHGACPRLVALVACGHYPYCDSCISSLKKKAGSPTFKCPYCSKEITETLIINLEEE